MSGMIEEGSQAGQGKEISLFCIWKVTSGVRCSILGFPAQTGIKRREKHCMPKAREHLRRRGLEMRRLSLHLAEWDYREYRTKISTEVCK